MYINSPEIITGNAGWYSGLNSTMLQPAALSGTGFMEALLGALENAGVTGVENYREFLKDKYGINGASKNSQNIQKVNGSNTSVQSVMQSGTVLRQNALQNTGINRTDGSRQKTISRQDENFRHTVEAAERQKQMLIKAYKKNLAGVMSFMQKSI